VYPRIAVTDVLEYLVESRNFRRASRRDSQVERLPSSSGKSNLAPMDLVSPPAPLLQPAAVLSTSAITISFPTASAYRLNVPMVGLGSAAFSNRDRFPFSIPVRSRMSARLKPSDSRVA